MREERNSWLSKAFQKNSWPFLNSLFLTLNRCQSRLSSADDNWMRKRNQRLHWFYLSLPIVSFASGSWDAKAATILINWFWNTGATFPTNQIQNLNRLRLCTRTRVLPCFSIFGSLKATCHILHRPDWPAAGWNALWQASIFQLRQQTHPPSHPPQFNCKLTMSRPGQFIIAGSIIRNLEACSRFGRVWRTEMCRYDVIEENKDVLCLFSPNSWDKKRNQRCFYDLNCKFFLVNIHYFSSPAHAAEGVNRS